MSESVDTGGPWTVREPWNWLLLGVVAVAFVSLLLSFQAGVFLLLFLLVGWWSWHYPLSALSLLVVVAPLLPMLKITQTIGTVTIVKDVIIATLFFKLFALPLLTKKLPYRRNILVAPLLLLIGWELVNVWRAEAPILGLLRARVIGLYIMLYLAVLYAPLSKEYLQRWLKWFLASAVIVLLLAGYQWFLAPDSTVLRFDPVREIWIPRLSSVLAHPSILGQYLITLITLLVAVFWHNQRSKYRLGLVALSLISLGLIYLTFSRAVWFGIVAALGAMAASQLLHQWQTRKQVRVSRMPARGRLLLSGLGLVVLAVLVWQFTPVGIFVRSSFDPNYASNEDRLIFMARLLAPISNFEALFGQGLGDVLTQNFRETNISAYDIASGAARSVQLAKNRTLVDNQYLKTFVELGLMGVLIYGWIYWRLAKQAYLLISNRHSQTSSLIGLWGIGFLTAFVVQGFFIDIWDIFPTNAAFWLLAALVSWSAAPAGRRA